MAPVLLSGLLKPEVSSSVELLYHHVLAARAGVCVASQSRPLTHSGSKASHQISDLKALQVC